MKCLLSVTAASVIALLIGTTAWAQNNPAGTTSASDNAAPPAASAGEGDKAAEGDSSDEKDNSCRWCMHGKLADPWTLPQPDFLQERNITVGGWLEGGIYANQYGAPNNGPIGFRGIGDGFTVDQMWVYAERKTDTKGCGWDIGGRIDYVFGVDGPQTQAFGDQTWDYGWNSSRQYGSAIPQIYTEIAYDDVKVKIGRFYTPIGYEVVQAPQNFFYSHSYSFAFGSPFTHTGALASYQPDEQVTYYGGWVNGWDEGFDGKDGGSMFLGGLSWKISEKANLAWYVSAGKLGTGDAFPGAASGNLYFNCFVFTYKLNDKWTYVLENDLGTNTDVNPGSVDNQWYEIDNYLFRKLNDCWSVGGRFEWFQDPQGARVVAGDRGNYFAMTSGFNYKPHANVDIRPEIRYDWFNGTAGPNGLPFNGGSASSQLSGGFDIYFTF